VKTITLLNQKGGVGKTSCTHHLSGTLAALGHRVLLVDNDPQASLSRGFFGPDAVEDLDPAETVAAIYAGARPFPEQVVRPTGIAGLDLVLGSKAATHYNLPDPEHAHPDDQECLRDFLVQASADYDFVLIDCPPNLHLCSWSALVASDFLVVPLQPEDYGSQGIRAVSESLAMVRSGPNPALALLGYLLTMVARETIHRVYEASLRTIHGEAVFTAVVPRAPLLKESISVRKPIAQYKPKSPAAKAIATVAAELLARVESASAPVVVPTSRRQEGEAA
jgi:chromosome partitioning protein